MGAGVARALGPHKAVLMRHHGIAVAARSLAESVILAMMLEDACRIQLLATAAGGPAELFPPDDIKRLYDKITQPGLGSWIKFFGDPFHYKVIGDTLLLGVKTVCATVLIGYPLALVYLDLPTRLQKVLIFIIVLLAATPSLIATLLAPFHHPDVTKQPAKA